MVNCDSCLRANPPTRTDCLYCGKPLPITSVNEDLRKPSLRMLEAGEIGYSVVHVGSSLDHRSDEERATICDLLGLDYTELAAIVAAEMPLPLVMLASVEDAELIRRRLSAFGFEVMIVSDIELGISNNSLHAVRLIELHDSELIASIAGGREQLFAVIEDLALMVTGRLVTRDSEIEERGRKRKRSIVNGSEVAKDEMVLDLYFHSTRESWRVFSSSFDYSLLGNQKKLTVAENFSLLLKRLQELAVHLQHDDSYGRYRHLLSNAWPYSQRTGSIGFHREGPGRYRTGAVTTTDNVTQFTRFSRLRKHFRISFSATSEQAVEGALTGVQE